MTRGVWLIGYVCIPTDRLIEPGNTGKFSSKKKSTIPNLQTTWNGVFSCGGLTVEGSRCWRVLTVRYGMAYIGRAVFHICALICVIDQ